MSMPRLSQELTEECVEALNYDDLVRRLHDDVMLHWIPHGMIEGRQHQQACSTPAIASGLLVDVRMDSLNI